MPARSERFSKGASAYGTRDTVLEASQCFKALQGQAALLSAFHEGRASGKRRRAMAAAKQIPVSMLSGFLGSGAFLCSIQTCSP